MGMTKSDINIGIKMKSGIVMNPKIVPNIKSGNNIDAIIKTTSQQTVQVT